MIQICYVYVYLSELDPYAGLLLAVSVVLGYTPAGGLFSYEQTAR